MNIVDGGGVRIVHGGGVSAIFFAWAPAPQNICARYLYDAVADFALVESGLFTYFYEVAPQLR